MSRPTLLFIVPATLALVAWWMAQDTTVRGGSSTGAWVPVPSNVGSVQGRLLVDPGVPADGLTVELSHRVDAAEIDLFLPVEVDASGFFAYTGLPPGRASIAARAGATVVARRENLVVRPHEQVTVDLDLTGLVHRFEFTLEDVDGAAPAAAVVGWRPSSPEDSGETYAHWALAKEGRVELIEGSPVIDLLVLARGSATEELFGVGHGRPIPLPEPWTVLLNLPPEVEPATDGTEIAVLPRRVTVDGRIARASSTGGEFYERLEPVPFVDGQAVLDLPRGGEWLLDWRAWRDGEALDLGRARAAVTIDEGVGYETLHPAFPVDVYRAALAR